MFAFCLTIVRLLAFRSLVMTISRKTVSHPSKLPSQKTPTLPAIYGHQSMDLEAVTTVRLVASMHVCGRTAQYWRSLKPFLVAS